MIFIQRKFHTNKNAAQTIFCSSKSVLPGQQKPSTTYAVQPMQPFWTCSDHLTYVTKSPIRSNKITILTRNLNFLILLKLYMNDTVMVDTFCPCVYDITDVLIIKWKIKSSKIKSCMNSYFLIRNILLQFKHARLKL